jgi:hypothetical protein
MRAKQCFPNSVNVPISSLSCTTAQTFANISLSIKATCLVCGGWVCVCGGVCGCVDMCVGVCVCVCVGGCACVCGVCGCACVCVSAGVCVCARTPHYYVLR